METSNKKILKNTIFLYIRMFIMMVLSFFTTRIVLQKLGASDYGVYNVVGGFVSMFTLLNSILQTGTNRFLALSLGKGDKTNNKLTFSTAFVIHLMIAGIVFVLLESFGIWFLNSKLNIESSSLFAANWVFQLSVISCMLTITQTPFTAAITANEKFEIYAYLSIFDVILKILIVYLLVVIPGDKLIVYAILMLSSTFVTMSLNRLYCVRKFEECAFSLKLDKQLFKEMVSFSGWTTVGHLSAVLNGQGVNVLLNLFFGTIINASRGLAITVVTTVKQFVGGFTTAAVPQLVKYYGKGDKENFNKLVFKISQVTLFLLAIFIVPIMLEIDYVLKLWLTEVPAYTSTFIKISLILAFISYSNFMIDQAVNAIGRVKEMNLWVTPIYLIVIPISYVILKKGGGPTTTYWVSSAPMIIALFLNLLILNRFYGFPVKEYLLRIVGKNLLFILLSSIIPLIVQYNMCLGLVRFIVVCSLSVISTIIIMYCFALDHEARSLVRHKVQGAILKFKKHSNDK